jgi:hypothetical protein
MKTSLTRLAVQPRAAQPHDELDTIGLHLFPPASSSISDDHEPYDSTLSSPFARTPLSSSAAPQPRTVSPALSIDNINLDGVNLNCTHVYSGTYAENLHTLAQTKPSPSAERALVILPPSPKRAQVSWRYLRTSPARESCVAGGNGKMLPRVGLILSETALLFILAML